MLASAYRRGWIAPPSARPRLLAAALLVLSLGVALLVQFLVNPLLPLGLLLAACVVAFSTRHLLPGAMLLIFLAADGLGVFGLTGIPTEEGLPYVQAGAGLRLTIRDLLLIGLLPIALVQLWARRDRPVFIVPMLALVATIGCAFGLGVLRDGDAKAAFQFLRSLFSYALYPILIAAIDSPRKLNVVVATVSAIAVASVGLQLVEIAQGAPLAFLAPPQALGQALAGLQLAGMHVPYVWNRALFHLFLALFLSLGAVLDRRRTAWHLVIASICFIGFAVSLQRSWYIFISVGAVALIIASRDWRARLQFIATVLTALVVLVAVAIVGSAQSHLFGGSFLEVWAARTQTVLSLQTDSSYQQRLVELAQQWKAFLNSPIVGYGLSRDAQHFVIDIGRLDTGAINTLLLFGGLGFAAFVALVINAFGRAVFFCRQLPGALEHPYALGLVGAWTGVVVGYILNWDFLTYPNGAWLVVLMFSIGDRIVWLQRRE